MEREMNNELRDKIKSYIKNKLDISELIEGVLIKGENLSNSIIKKLNKSYCDISGCDFSNSVIGEDGIEIHLTGAYAQNCNFRRTIFKGSVMARRIDARGSNLQEAYLPYIDYRYAKLQNCNFCDAVFVIGTKRGYGAEFDDKFFKDLANFWGIEIKLKSMEEKNGIKE